MSETCLRVELGRLDYREAWALQKRLVAARQAGEVEDLLLFVEHPPTYTLGRSGKREHLLADEQTLAALGASFVETDRGGDITYHGPGQLVVYPIFDLANWNKDLHAYLRALEEVVLRTLSDFGVEAGREPGLTGVWHPEGKIAAIGVRVSRWVTSHGLALNVSTRLADFNHIVPCGIVGRRVTSMEAVLNKPVAGLAVRDRVAHHVGSVFGRRLVDSPDSALVATAPAL